MSNCQNPFCDNAAVYGGKFCCTSCRAGYHQNHKAGLEAVAAELVRSKLVKMGTGAHTAELMARNLYRVAKGRERTPGQSSFVDPGAKAPETLETCPKCKTKGFTVQGLARHVCTGEKRN